MFYDNTDQTCHVEPIIPNAVEIKAHRSYTYGRKRSGAVISFKANINTGALVAFGAEESKVSGINYSSKEPINMSVSTNSPATQPTAGPQRDPVKINGKLASRTYQTSQQTDAGMYAEALNMKQRAELFNMTSELTIVGDPLIRPSMFVDLTVLSYKQEGIYSVPYVHFTSGLFAIESVRHVMQGGEYISVLELRRKSARSSTDFADASDRVSSTGDVTSFVTRGDAPTGQTPFNSSVPTTYVLR
jgi:hypothetical protein